MKKKKLVFIELARTIASFFVVGAHATEEMLNLSSTYFVDNFISLSFQSACTIFFIITGFFIFRNEYKKLLINTLKRIWLPATLISVFCTVFYDFYIGTLVDTNIINYIFGIIYNIFCFKYFGPTCKHFWYIYTYCLVVIIYPVLKSFVDYIDEDSKRQKKFIIISFTLIIINEITLNEFACVGSYGFSTLVMASIEIIYGHLIYINKDKIFNRNISTFLCIIFCFIANCVRTLIDIVLMKNGLNTRVITWWFSIFSVIIAILILKICNNLVDNSKESFINNLILKCGSLSFDIYLFHKFPIKLLNKFGFESFVCNKNILVRVITITLFATICYAFSLIISMIYEKILLFFRKIINNKVEVNKYV